ncbi:OmpA family protein [bacterium]|nr:OmpA family protein [bacterium]
MKKLTLLILLLLTALMMVGCITGKKLKQQIKHEHARLNADEKRGADKCVPVELAKAYSYLDFAQASLDMGDYRRVYHYLNAEKAMAHITAEKADSCIPKDADKDGVLDKNDACPTKPGLKQFAGCPDTDGDGISDKDDKCPLVKGVFERKGCPADKDSDGDNIPDKIDHCPFDKEDFDKFKDEDGCPDPDNDMDGVLDAQDLCPLKKGPATNQGCPVNDKDGDGIPDEIDKCPEQPEDIDTFEDQDGCPDPNNDGDELLDVNDKCPLDKGPTDNYGCPILDTDGDGVPDIVDKCKMVPEDIDKFEDEDGCPDPDNDKDGVLDVDDKCPITPGVKEEKGCPKKYKLIVVKAAKIELKQKVFFKTGKAVINAKSFKMLKEVADAVKSIKTIKKIVVEGHTDGTGSRKYNLRLSQKRAEAVLNFLVKHGVSRDRIEAKGYGPDKPIASNRTRAGRSKNRRVEFKIEQ